jgi:cell division protein FtsL
VDSGDPAAQGAATRRRIDIGTWGPWLTMACILAGGLFVAWAKMDTTQLTYEVHQLRSEQAQLTREQRLLSSELSHLQSPAYLSAHASDLGLQEPPPGVVIRVE